MCALKIDLYGSTYIDEMYFWYCPAACALFFRYAGWIRVLEAVMLSTFDLLCKKRMDSEFWQAH